MLRAIDVDDNLKGARFPCYGPCSKYSLIPPVIAPILLFYPQSKVPSTKNGYLKAKLQIDLLKV